MSVNDKYQAACARLDQEWAAMRTLQETLDRIAFGSGAIDIADTRFARAACALVSAELNKRLAEAILDRVPNCKEAPHEDTD